MTKTITPFIHQVLWLPGMQHESGTMGVLEAHYCSLDAPWVPHGNHRSPTPPAFLTALADRIVSQTSPIDVTDGTTTIHAVPQVTAIRMHYHPELTCVINVGWFHGTQQVHGTQFTLDIEMAAEHQAFLDDVASKATLRL